MRLFLLSLFGFVGITGFAASEEVPKTWDEVEMQGLALPLADALASPAYAPSDYYYQIPVRPIYRSYPVYHPDKEPSGYFEGLLEREPELLWDGQDIRPKLDSDADWITAGELVFDAPIIIAGGGRLGPSRATHMVVRNAEWHAKTGAAITPDGILPFYRYVVRERGKVEVGALSCAQCHTRVMPDGSVIKGAQGNFPFGKVFEHDLNEEGVIEPAYRGMMHELFSVPWLQPDPQAGVDALPLDQIAAAHAATPPGVMARHGTGTWSPVQVPDLIGVETRRYLDRTGLQRHRGPADLMRYAALNQGMDRLTSFTGLLVSGQKDREPPDQVFEQRYSDEQLYALAKYIYSLRPPPNPNLPEERAGKELVDRGRDLFMNDDNRCSTCHDPKQGYTNNKLVAAPGFQVPTDHPERDAIMRQRVETDSTLTLTTRRGTGLYKVPSLLGVWYRGPFEHNGSCATLEDWFDPERLDESHVPTGWRGVPGTKTRAVKGHEFGLDLSREDRKALIAFLKTL